MRRAGVPMEAIKAAQAAVDKMRTTTKAALVDDDLDQKINELWLRKREEEEAERRSEQEVPKPQTLNPKP
jgi:non-homologous end joining protein Ku